MFSMNSSCKLPSQLEAEILRLNKNLNGMLNNLAAHIKAKGNLFPGDKINLM